MKRNILWINGIFLVVSGFLFWINVGLGHFYKIGLFKTLQPMGVLGVLEAYSLAIFVGIVLLRIHKKAQDVAFGNFLAAGVHFTLMTYNLCFWSSVFVVIQAEIPGAIATTVHFVFVITELWAGIGNRKNH